MERSDTSRWGVEGLATSDIVIGYNDNDYRYCIARWYSCDARSFFPFTASDKPPDDKAASGSDAARTIAGTRFGSTTLRRTAPARRVVRTRYRLPIAGTAEATGIGAKPYISRWGGALQPHSARSALSDLFAMWKFCGAGFLPATRNGKAVTPIAGVHNLLPHAGIFWRV